MLYNDETNNSGWDYHALLIIVSQSSGGESLMQSYKSLIDSSWPSHQSLHGHCLHITEALLYFPPHHHGTLGKQNHGPMQKVT